MRKNFSINVVSPAVLALATIGFAATPVLADHHKGNKPHTTASTPNGASNAERQRPPRGARGEDRGDARMDREEERRDRMEEREERMEDRMEERRERMESRDERPDRTEDRQRDMDMDRARFEERGANNGRMRGETGRRMEQGIGTERRMRDIRTTDRALPAPAIDNSRAPVRVNCPAGTTAQPNGTCLITGDFVF